MASSRVGVPPGRFGEMRVPMRTPVPEPELPPADEAPEAAPEAPAARPDAARPAPASGLGPLGAFCAGHFRHYNAGILVQAADAYRALLDRGGQMVVSLAGAMSTAEIGRSLAPLIRAGKVHAISCTGANLEEDLFNLVAHQHYVQLPNYQDLTPQQDQQLLRRHINRVTDVGIPEKAAMTPIEQAVHKRWAAAEAIDQRIFPHEPLYKILRSGELKAHYQADPAHSWLLAAAERNLPIVVPGWEDSTLGNVFAAEVLQGRFAPTLIRSGIEYMVALADWYRRTAPAHPLGFFQVGGGIPGDFAICVVPLLQQDADTPDTPFWAYFCQITDATESYGGYSGALPAEKITWGKIEPSTPRFAINSDATIVFPLIAAQVLGW